MVKRYRIDRNEEIEYIKNHIAEVDHKDSLDFLYFFIKAHVEKVWEKENK